MLGLNLIWSTASKTLWTNFSSKAFISGICARKWRYCAPLTTGQPQLGIQRRRTEHFEQILQVVLDHSGLCLGYHLGVISFLSGIQSSLVVRTNEAPQNTMYLILGQRWTGWTVGTVHQASFSFPLRKWDLFKKRKSYSKCQKISWPLISIQKSKGKLVQTVLWHIYIFCQIMCWKKIIFS